MSRATAAESAVLLRNGRTSDDHGDTMAYTAMESLFCAA